jgi:hypothetical protein
MKHHQDCTTPPSIVVLTNVLNSSVFETEVPEVDLDTISFFFLNGTPASHTLAEHFNVWAVLESSVTNGFKGTAVQQERQQCRNVVVVKAKQLLSTMTYCFQKRDRLFSTRLL